MIGPRIEPWGTPHKRDGEEDKNILKADRKILLSDRSDLNHSNAVLLWLMLWSTVSKAAVRLRSMRTV